MPISAAYGNVIDVQELLELLLHGRLAQIRLLGQDVEPEKKKKKKVFVIKLELLVILDPWMVAAWHIPVASQSTPNQSH